MRLRAPQAHRNARPNLRSKLRSRIEMRISPNTVCVDYLLEVGNLLNFEQILPALSTHDPVCASGQPGPIANVALAIANAHPL